MSWARMDDSRADNPKLLAAGFAARGLDEAAIEMCARHETDGYVTDDQLAMLAVGHREKQWRRLVARLVDVGRWEAAGAGRWHIHDYLDYNPSHAEREAERDRKRSAGKLGGVRSGEARTKQAASEPANQGASEKAKLAGASRPVPTRPDPKGQDSRRLYTHEPPEHPATNGENPVTQQSHPPPAVPVVALADRLVTVCAGYENPRMVRQEAARVVAWATAALDATLIDEAIGDAAGWPKPPVLPRAVAAHILHKAADRRIHLAPFAPSGGLR